MYDICIIGGGASGLAAAVTAARISPEVSICILEKKDALGKKIYATGNGRCNLSNESCDSMPQILDFFASMGIITVSDRQGRIYPASGHAADIVKAFEKSLFCCHADIMVNHTAEKISYRDGTFYVRSSGRTFEAGRLLIAAGGKAGPQYGTTGDGYTFARQMGHSVSRIFPALTALECQGDFTFLKGARASVLASLSRKDGIVSQEKGEVQFTEDGLSGICIFDLSRFVDLYDGGGVLDFRDYHVSLDFMPSSASEEIMENLMERRSLQGFSAGDMLLSFVNPLIAADIIKKAGIRPDDDIADISDRQIRKLTELLKNWETAVTGAKGWKKAQCTAGGVAAEEVDQETMESKLIRNLYFAGEVLDYDGPCGGFNLNHAWETGIRAGRAMSGAEIVQDT